MFCCGHNSYNSDRTEFPCTNFNFGCVFLYQEITIHPQHTYFLGLTQSTEVLTCVGGTADDVEPERGGALVGDGQQADVARRDGAVQQVRDRRVRVRVAHEHLPTPRHRTTLYIIHSPIIAQVWSFAVFSTYTCAVWQYLKF